MNSDIVKVKDIYKKWEELNNYNLKEFGKS